MIVNEKIERDIVLKTRSLPFFVIILVIFLDQITKYLVSSNIPLYGFVNILPNVLNISHVRNPGGAFGFMSQSSYEIRSFIFIGASCFTIAVIIFYFRRISYHNKLLSFGLSLVLGGAIGNTVDRLCLGEVIDFIDIVIYSYHWPAFNVADSAITIGIIVATSHTTRNAKNIN